MYYILRDSTCSTVNNVYIAYCKKCKKQDVEFTISWKPRLCSYKSHIKKRIFSCRIATHFIDKCCDEQIPFKHLAFIIIDVVNNTSCLTRNQIEDLLLEKEKFRIDALVTQHQGLNSTHDWNCSKRTEREKINT